VDAGRVFGSWQKPTVNLIDPSYTSYNVMSLINSDENNGLALARAGLDYVDVNLYREMLKTTMSPQNTPTALENNGFKAGATRPRSIAFYGKTRL